MSISSNVKVKAQETTIHKKCKRNQVKVSVLLRETGKIYQYTLLQMKSMRSRCAYLNVALKEIIA